MAKEEDIQEDYQYIGTLSKAKGFRGDILLKDMQKGISTLVPGCEIRVGYSLSFAEAQTLERFSMKGSPVMSFRGVDDESKAARFQEKAAFTLRENINPESRGRPTLTEDIIGTEIFDTDTQDPIGIVVDIYYTPANQIWVIQREDGVEIPLPAVPNFIHKHDAPTKKAWVSLPEGIDQL